MASLFQVLQTPGKPLSASKICISEMIARIPFEHAFNLTDTQNISLLTDTVPHPAHNRMSRLLFFPTKTQIDCFRFWIMRLSIVDPSGKPDRW